MRHEFNVRVHLVQALHRGVDLGAADIGAAVEQLAVQVRLVDDVEVHQAEAADAGGGQVHPERRAEAAGADHQHLGGLELQLPLGADLGHDEVPAVAEDLVRAQFGRGRLGRRLGHRAAGDRRDDRQRGIADNRRRLAPQVAHVLVVQEQVDEAPELAVVGEQVGSQPFVEGHEFLHRLADGRAGHGNFGLFTGEAPQGRGDLYEYGHRRSPAYEVVFVRPAAAASGQWIGSSSNRERSALSRQLR